MQCLVLAGGLGTRIQKISDGKPKALLPLGPKAFIEWQLLWLKKNGFNEVILALGHKSDAITECIEKSKSKDFPEIQYVVDGPKLLGTGGAIRNAAPLLNSTFSVTYGDTVLFVKSDELEASHRTQKKPVTLAVFKNSNVGDKSNVRWNGNQLIYNKANPAKDMDYIDYGFSVYDKNYFLQNTPEGAFDLATFLQDQSLDGHVAGFEAKRIFLEIGSVEGYENLKKAFAKANYDLSQL